MYNIIVMTSKQILNVFIEVLGTIESVVFDLVQYLTVSYCTI